MKLKYTLLGMALGLPMLLSARPASPRIFNMQNADGSTVELRCFGNEDFSWFTDVDGNVVMEQNTAGNWVEARRNGRVIRPIESDLAILRSELTPFATDTQLKTRMAPIDRTLGRTTFPTLQQDVHSLVVLIEYADTKFRVEDPRQAIDDMVNKEGYDAFGSCGSARDYYIATSGGLFSPIFDVVGPVTVSRNSEYYVGNDTNLSGAGKQARFGMAIEEALKLLDDQIDFSKYDYDDDGDIDNVFFFYAGYGQADTGKKTTVWPHQADFVRYTTDTPNSLGLEPLYLDGKRFGPYACSNELNGNVAASRQPYLDGIGAFCHEFGHVLGLPDLYDTTGSYGPTPGNWSLMANGSYNGNSCRPPLFSAYEKWVCHWLEFEDVTAGAGGVMPQEGTTITVPGLETNTAFRFSEARRRPGFPIYKDEFFIAETRNNTGWDADLPDHGLLIWHINFDYSKWVNNTVNYTGFQGVSIVPSSKTTTTYNDANGVFIAYPGADNELAPTKYADVANSFWLTNISYNPATGTATFDYNKVTSRSDATVEITEVGRVKDGKGFQIVWAPVEGAEDYLVTVTSSIGTNIVNLGYDNTSVGKVTSVLVNNYADTFNSKEVTARVQAVFGGIPSTKYGEKTFVPQNLEVSGVGELEAGESIYALGSSIVAPEGARVFTLSGIETGRENLPKGVYIVVAGSKTVKVAVR